MRNLRSRLPLAAALAVGVSAAACAWLAREPMAPPRSDPPAGPVHRVEEGETLCSLGGRYGLSATALRSSNKIETGLAEPLPTGVSLRLEGTPATYTVRWGDTLLVIAEWSGTEMGALARYNGIADPHLLLEGQELRLPAGAASACAPAPRRVPPRPPKTHETPERSPAAPTDPSAPQELGDVAAAPPDTGVAEALLASAEERYAAADYEACFRAATLAREQLAPLSENPQTRRLGARAAAIEGLAHVGSQRHEEAVVAFRTAFALDPDFELDARYASPRILPLLEEAREPEAIR